jgi:Ca2+/Na+ antiporter
LHIYFAYDFIHHARDRKPVEEAEAVAIEEAVAGQVIWFHGKAGSLIQFILGAGIVVGGSRLLVDAAVKLAGALGIPSIIVGLTVITVGTSLPELLSLV